MAEKGETFYGRFAPEEEGGVDVNLSSRRARGASRDRVLAVYR